MDVQRLEESPELLKYLRAGVASIYRLSQGKDEIARQKHFFTVMWEPSIGFSDGKDYSCCLPENRLATRLCE